MKYDISDGVGWLFQVPQKRRKEMSGHLFISLWKDQSAISEKVTFPGEKKMEVIPPMILVIIFSFPSASFGEA